MAGRPRKASAEDPLGLMESGYRQWPFSICQIWQLRSQSLSSFCWCMFRFSNRDIIHDGPNKPRVCCAWLVLHWYQSELAGGLGQSWGRTVSSKQVGPSGGSPRPVALIGRTSIRWLSSTTIVHYQHFTTHDQLYCEVVSLPMIYPMYNHYPFTKHQLSIHEPLTHR